MTMARLKDRLVEAANRVWHAWGKWGPVDDGRPEGDEFNEALLELRVIARRTKAQTSQERAALVAIVNAADEVGNEPIHYKVKEAINHARYVIEHSDLEIEE
jgi:hypothetical protein